MKKTAELVKSRAKRTIRVTHVFAPYVLTFHARLHVISSYLTCVFSCYEVPSKTIDHVCHTCHIFDYSN